MPTSILDIYSKQEEQSGFLEKTGDFFQYGVADSVISAGVSFVNTAIALGNVFGAEGEYFETEEVIRNNLSDSAARYYEENQDLVDIVGLAAGSLLPGLGAIKAGRAVAQGLSNTKLSRLSTGLRDSLIPDTQYKALAKSIKNGNSNAALRGNRLSLLGQNATTQFTEAALYEAGTLLTMNQNSALNREDVGYFEAIGDNLSTAAFGLVLGGAIGTGAGYLVDAGKLKSLVRDMETALIDSRRIYNSGINANVGDEVMLRYEDITQASARLDQIRAMTKEEQAQFTVERNNLENLLSDATNGVAEVINGASVGQGYGTLVTEAFDAAGVSAADRQFALAGAVKFSPVPTNQRRGLTSSVAEVDDLELPGLFVKDYGDVIIDQTQAVARMRRDLLEGKLGTDKEDQLFLDAAGLLEAQDIKSLWNNRKVKVNLKDPSGKPIRRDSFDPEELLEFGAPASKKGKVPKYLQTSLDVETSLRNFAFDYDPVYQRAVDGLGAAKRTDDNEAIGYWSMELANLNAPENVFASAYRVLNSSELDPKLLSEISSVKGRYKPLYDWLDNNKALRSKYGQKSAYFNMRSGKVVNDTPAANVADLGKVKLDAKKVTAGREVFKIVPTKGVDNTTTEASARFAWMEAIKFGGGTNLFAKGKLRKEWAENLSTEDLPLMQGVLKHYDFSNGPLKIAKPDGTTTDIANTLQMNQLVANRKREIILEFSAAGKMEGRNLSEVAIYADASEDYVNAIQSGASSVEARKVGAEFLTEDTIYKQEFTNSGDLIEKFQPTHVKIDYDSKVFDKYGDRDTGLVAAQQRTKATQDTAEAIATKLLGVNAPSARTDRNGAVTFADDVTSVDETTTVVRALNSDYGSGQSIIQAAGKALQELIQTNQQKIFAALNDVGRAVNANPAAIAELSILQQATLRSGKYEVMEASTFQLDNVTVDSLQNLGINPYALLEQRVFKDNGFDLGGDHIIEQATLQRVKEEMSKIVVDEQTFNTIQQVKLQQVNDPAAGGKLLEELRAAYQAQIDEVITAVGNEFTTTATATGAKTVHAIRNPEVMTFLKAHRNVNTEYAVQPSVELGKAWGRNSQLDGNVLYPGRLDTKRFGHIAFVKMKNEATDPWAAKGQGVLTAFSAQELRRKVAHFKSNYDADEILIETTEQIKRRTLAEQEYKAELSMSDTFIDESLRKDGKLWDVNPELNPNVVSEMIDGIANQHSNALRQAQKLRYGPEIATLEQFHRVTQMESGVGKAAFEGQSVYKENINQLLGLSSKDNHTFWQTAQEKADEAVSRGVRALQGNWLQAKTKGDWEEFSGLMDNYGLPKVYNEASDWILSNVKAPKPVLNKAISQSNGIFSFLMLRLDQAHAMVNAMSLPIMLVPEVKSLIGSIANMSEDKIKRLGIATEVPVNAEGLKMPSNMKLMQQATKNLWADNSMMDEYVARGIVGSDVQELRTVMNEVRYSPQGDWSKRVNKVANTLATPVDYSEKATRFIAADTARQVLDIAGVPKNHELYWATISTFVSRTNGNYAAAQRPTLFQGWAGQAVGLFQTYQFNLFQQFMKHIEEGNGAAKYLAGIQGATFGAQSLPGFQLMNQHIGERTFGEKDFYSTVSDSFDNPVSDFLLYGGASSLTRPILNGKGIDFYSRGNLTPRTPILIPTSFDEVPAISFYSKLVGNMYNVMNQLSSGAPAGPTFLNALATNGLNRPLAGAAQIWQGQKTTQAGTKMFDYSDVDYATTITKLMGSRTLDEGIATNAFYRAQGYRNSRLAGLQELGTVVKSKIRNGEDVLGGELQGILQEYNKRGGDSGTFKRWMMNTLSGANTSTVISMRDKLNSPEGNYMQKVMGSVTTEYDNTKFYFK